MNNYFQTTDLLSLFQYQLELYLTFLKFQINNSVCFLKNGMGLSEAWQVLLLVAAKGCPGERPRERTTGLEEGKPNKSGQNGWLNKQTASQGVVFSLTLALGEPLNGHIFKIFFSPVKPSKPKCELEGELTEGSDLTLQCESASGTKPIVYYWQRIREKEGEDEHLPPRSRIGKSSSCPSSGPKI